MSNLDMEKKKKADEAKVLADEMRELILYCGITAKAWDDVTTDLDHKRDSAIEFVVRFLKELRSNLYAEIHRVWTQPHVTPEMWHNYKILFDRPTLIEQKQMNVCAKKLKIVWKSFKDQLKIESRAKEDNLGTSPNKIKETT